MELSETYSKVCMVWPRISWDRVDRAFSAGSQEHLCEHIVSHVLKEKIEVTQLSGGMLGIMAWFVKCLHA